MNFQRGYLVPALLAMLAACPSAGGQEEMDLPTAMQRALKKNRDLVRSARNLRSDHLQVQSAQAAFATRVNPDAQIGTTEDGQTTSYGLRASKRFTWGTDVSVGGHVSQVEEEDGDDIHRATVEVALSQPLFRNFGPLVHRESLIQADRALRRARRTYAQQKADLIMQVVMDFETIIRLERQIQSDENLYSRMEKLYRLTKARERQGRGTRVDSLRVELQRGEASLRLTNSRETLSTTERSFAELLGAKPETRFALAPPPLLKIDVPEIKKAVRVALENRLDYAQVQEDYSDHVRAVRIARRGLYPDISLKASYLRFGEGARNADAMELDQDDWYVGLTAGTDFSRREERITLSKAQVRERSAADTVQIKELSIARSVQQHITTYRRAQTRIKISDRNLTLAEGRAKLARRLFKMGRGDNFSVTDAEEAYVQAQNNVLNARADLSISGYSLLRSLGTLTDYPNDLKPRKIQNRDDPP